jgi:ketosteroid isomerase-like protein
MTSRVHRAVNGEKLMILARSATRISAAVFLLALSYSAVCMGQEAHTAASSARVRDELLRIVNEQFSAITRGDMAAYGSSMSEDLLYIPDWGTVYSKQQILARTLRTFNEGVGKIFQDVRDVHVVDHGNSAILTCEVVERMIYGDQELRDKLRRTVHFVRRNGRWLAVMIQFTTVPESHRIAVKTDSTVLDAYVGRYAWTSGLVNTFSREGGSLVSQWRPTSSKNEQLPLNDSTFFFRDDFGLVIFEKDSTGRVTHYIYRRADGQEFRADRMP